MVQPRIRLVSQGDHHRKPLFTLCCQQTGIIVERGKKGVELVMQMQKGQCHNENDSNRHHFVPVSNAPTLRGKRPEHPKAFSSSVHNRQLTDNTENKSPYVICGHVLQR